MEYVSTNNAPGAIGPYSQAVKANGLLFTSGQIAINPETTLAINVPKTGINMSNSPITPCIIPTSIIHPKNESSNLIKSQI